MIGPLSDAALENRWLAWRHEIRANGKRTKVPYDANTGHKASSTDPETWSTRRRAERFAPSDGVGLVLGNLGDGRALIGIDLDSCRDPSTREREDWADDIIQLMDSYTEISPSKEGYKIFATIDSEHGLEGGSFVEEGSTKEDHPPAIEVFFGGRYFAVTDSDVGKRPLRHVCAATMRKVLSIARAFAGRDTQSNADEKHTESDLASVVRMTPGSWSADQVKMILDHLDRDTWCEPRNDGWLKVGQALHHQYRGSVEGLQAWNDFSEPSGKFDAEDSERVWKSFGQSADPFTVASLLVAARKHDKWNERKFKRLSDDTEAERSGDGIVGLLNQDHAVVSMSGNTVVARFRDVPKPTIDFSAPAQVHAWFSNHKVIGAAGTPVPISTVWMASKKRREYPNGVVFDPSDNEPEGTLNLWRGWGVKENDKGEAGCKRILKHIREVISAGDAGLSDYNIKFDAHMVQHPREKPGVARVLRGTEGIGKDSYGKVLSIIAGPRHTAHIGDSQRMTARFNSQFESALHAHVEEAFFAGDRRERGKLYHLITAADVTIERKGIEPFQVNSFLRILMSTNEEWAVPVGRDARRFCVMDVSDRRRGDLAYFNALHAEIDGDGAGAYLAYLKSIDLTGFDVRKVPHTSALDDQKRASLASVEAWWSDAIESREWWGLPDDDGFARRKEGLYDAYVAHVRGRRFGGDARDVRAFWKTFYRMCPGAFEKRGPRDGEDRKRLVVLPSLWRCRRDFDRHIGVNPTPRTMQELLGEP